MSLLNSENILGDLVSSGMKRKFFYKENTFQKAVAGWGSREEVEPRRREEGKSKMKEGKHHSIFFFLSVFPAIILLPGDTIKKWGVY
jgi:hypothetical protein